jgi:hypothetical protein
MISKVELQGVDAPSSSYHKANLLRRFASWLLAILPRTRAFPQSVIFAAARHAKKPILFTSAVSLAARVS